MDRRRTFPVASVCSTMSSSSESYASSNGSSGDRDSNRQITPATSVSEDESIRDCRPPKRAFSALDDTASHVISARPQSSSKRARLVVETTNANSRRGPGSSPRPSNVIVSAARATLESILKNPIAFLPASSLTHKAELGSYVKKRLLRNQTDVHDSRRQLVGLMLAPCTDTS